MPIWAAATASPRWSVAASCPHAEVWGFDFNPAHVEFANDLAARAGLTNVRFVETSFADLEALPDAALPDFDLMVSHGVLSWISPANRRHLVGTVAKRLKPGGLAYLSYNVTTGWTLDGADAGADADAGRGEPRTVRCRGARRAGFRRSAEAGRRAVFSWPIRRSRTG